MNNVDVDARRVLNMFSELSTQKQKRVYRKALTEGARILQKKGKQELRSVLGKAVTHKNWWNGKTLQNGIKVSPQRDIEKDGVKVHILNDFRLKFFEMGTKERRTTGNNGSVVRGRDPLYRQSKPHSTGRIKQYNFFTKAKSSTENEIFNRLDKMISDNIKRIYNK